MTEHDALVLSYIHLANFPRANEALRTLQKVASLVKPIMRARGWKVGELAEFYPNQTSLLGTLNSTMMFTPKLLTVDRSKCGQGQKDMPPPAISWQPEPVHAYGKRRRYHAA